ncbi:ribonuclease H-like domain-containing protein [Tanacetum coccineum]
MTVTIPTPVILISDKLMTINNLTTLVPVKLDVDEMNYSSLVCFLKNICKGFEVLKHVLGEPTDKATSSNLSPPTPEWFKIDSIVLSWIFITLSITIQAWLVVEDPQMAKEAWNSLKLEDLSIDAYFCKIESIATILTSLGSPISNDDVVNIALEGLPDKYENVSSIIVHREPFPDLKMIRSMLTTEEIPLMSRAQATSIDSTSSSPKVLLANSGNSTQRPNIALIKLNKPCFNFAKGFCRFGDNYKFIHEGTSNGVNGNNLLWSTSNAHPTSSSTTTPHMTQEQMMALIQTQQALLAQLMYNGNTIVVNIGNTPTTTYGTILSNMNNVRPVAFTSYTHRPVQSLAQDPTTGNYNMDTVGDGYSILVTNSAHSISPTSHRPLQLNSFHHKHLADGILSHYKARLVANGSTWLLGIDVDETFSLVVKLTTIPTRKYATEILERTHMVSCNPSRTPFDTESKLGADDDLVSNLTLYQSLAGALWYLTFTRQDISYAVQQIFLYMHDPWERHFSSLKRILRLTSGYCVFHGNNLLSWSSKRQPTLSRSSTEAEYRGVANAVAETFQHQRTKHIEIDIHFVHNLLDAGQDRVRHVPSRYQYTDIFTKGLPSTLFEKFPSNLSVRFPPAQTAGECYLRPSENYHVSSNVEYTQNIQCSQYIEYPVNEKNKNLNIGSSQNYNKDVDDDEDDDDDQEGGGDDQQEKIGYNSDIDGDDFDEFVHEEGEGACLDGKGFQVKKFNDNHTCSKTIISGHHRNATAKLVGFMIKDELSDINREIRPKDIMKDMSRRHGLNLTYSQAYRSKNKGLEMLMGSPYKSFQKFPYYCYNLRNVNPGTRTNIKVDEHGRFEMLFIALGVAIDSFMNYLRPLVIIDGAHLKDDVYHGVNLLAVGMDGNNQTLPIAFGICQGEDGAGWTWFLEELKACISQKLKLSIISDTHPAILKSVKKYSQMPFMVFVVVI